MYLNTNLGNRKIRSLHIQWIFFIQPRHFWYMNKTNEKLVITAILRSWILNVKFSNWFPFHFYFLLSFVSTFSFFWPAYCYIEITVRFSWAYQSMKFQEVCFFCFVFVFAFLPAPYIHCRDLSLWFIIIKYFQVF